MIDIIHLTITAALVGIIWIIQCIHYPSFKYVDSDLAGKFHNFHTTSITPIVAPLMCAELAISIYDIWLEPSFVHGLHLALVSIIWISTFAIQVPLHQKLSKKYVQRDISNLIRTNWIRTLAWTIKLCSMVSMIL